MGVASFDRRCLEVVQRLAGNDHLSVMVGAGASIAAQLPGWEDLVIGLLAKGRGRSPERVARLLAASQGYLLAAEAALPPTLTAAQRKRRVARALYGDEPRSASSPASSTKRWRYSHAGVDHRGCRS